MKDGTNSDEYVDTSDADEREALAAQKPAYWSTFRPISPPRKRRKLTNDDESHAQTWKERKGHQSDVIDGMSRGLGGMSVTPSPKPATEAPSSTPPLSPPSRPNALLGPSCVAHLDTSTSSSQPGPDPNSSQSSSHIQSLSSQSNPAPPSPSLGIDTSTTLTRTPERKRQVARSPSSSLPVVTPVSPHTVVSLALHLRPAREDNFASSQDPLLLLSQQSGLEKSSPKQSDDEGEKDMDMDSDFLDSNPAQQPNPFLDANGDPLPVGGDDAELSLSQWFARPSTPCSLRDRPTDGLATFAPLSPLTPSPLPQNPRAFSLSPSPRPSPRSNLRPSQSHSESPPGPSAPRSSPQNKDGRVSPEARARYSLRTRNPRQLNPYEHDRMLYKRQMRAAPEAIVKVVSPSRQHRGGRQDGDLVDTETQQEYVPPPSPSSRRQPRQSGSGSGDDRGNDERWFPDIFNDLDNDDDDISLPRTVPPHGNGDPTTQARTAKKRRPRPFPLLDRSSLASDPRPGPKPRPRFAAQPDIQLEPALPPPETPSRSGSLTYPPSQAEDRRSLSPLPPLPVRPPTPAFMRAMRKDVDVVSLAVDSEPFGDFAGVDPVAPLDVADEVISIHSSPRHGLSQASPSRSPDVSRRSTSGPSRNSANSSSSEDSEREKMKTKDKKKLKALKRMFPAFMIKKMQDGPATKARQRARIEADSPAPSSEEEDLRPGQSKTRFKLRGVGAQPIEILGDSESSSDTDRGADGDSVVVISSEEDTSVMALDDDDDEAEDGGDDRMKNRSYRHQLAEVEIDAWLEEDAPVRRRRAGSANGGGPERLRDGDLIDRMLQRTHAGSSSRPRAPKKHVKASRRTGGSSSAYRGAGTTGPRIEVVTVAAARQLDKEKQTTLPFRKVTALRHSGPPNSRSQHGPIIVEDEVMDGDSSGDNPVLQEVEMNVQDMSEQAVAERNRQKKKEKKRRLLQGKLYVVPSDGKSIVSGRRQHRALVINDDDDGFRQALAPLQQSKLVLTKSAPSKRNHPVPVPTRTNGRIHRRVDRKVADDDDDQLTVEREGDSVPHQPSEWDRTEVVTPDFDITRLPLGARFASTTYISKGWLHELVSILQGTAPPSLPSSYSAFELNLAPTMGLRAFVDELGKMCDKILMWASSTNAEDLGESDRTDWHGLVRVASQLVSWVPCDVSPADIALLETEIPGIIDRLLGRFEDLTWGNDKRVFTRRQFLLLWFCVEVSTRVTHRLRLLERQCPINIFGKSVLLIVRTLYIFGLERPIVSVHEHQKNGSTQDETGFYTAELWVCLTHLLAICQTEDLTVIAKCDLPSLWVVIHTVVIEDQSDSATVLEASERIWRTLFGLSALSRFSVHGIITEQPRLPASWTTCLEALKRIRLTSDSKVDKHLTHRSISKRDQYVRTVITRCFILAKTWEWRLDDALGLIAALVEIFRSRRFANLRGESADFPRFVRLADYSLLSEFSSRDSAFTVFLKLVVRAAWDISAVHGAEDPKATGKIKKLLSFILPVGSVPFSKTVPPTELELSMLYNRLSAVSVAVYLEPTEPNARRRIKQAELFVRFAESDLSTRQACIRGVLQYAVLFSTLSLSLDDVLGWLAQITLLLVNEHTELLKSGLAQQHSISKKKVVIAIQMVIGAVRTILDTLSAASKTRHNYPNPVLLEGPWVTSVFAASSNLTTVPSTALEIQKLVSTFLKARASVLPAPRRPPLAPLANVESLESQDEYGMMDLDLNDPDLLAALGEAGDSSAADENTQKDKRVSEIINQHISPAIYRMVCKQFSGAEVDGPANDDFHETDKWIDCWVGCASVLVRNGCREWSHFLALGGQSWGRISNALWRRRVGLRFMFNVLKLDPMAYANYKDNFVQVWVESMVAGRLTMEHEYSALLFSVDGLRNPLLRDLPCERESDNVDYSFTRADFVDFRLPVLEGVFRNISSSLDREREGERSVHSLNQQWIGFLVVMFSTMRDTLEGLPKDSPARDAYAHYCRQILGHFTQFPRLMEQGRLADLIAWVNSI